MKAPAPDREPRLTELLTGIRQEASYRTFRTAAELGRLVRDDLATLLSERFAAARSAVPPPSPTTRSRRSLPRAATSLFGREQAIDEVAGLIERTDVALVTLTGPGGIGKTRLAMAVGERLRDRFDGARVRSAGGHHGTRADAGRHRPRGGGRPRWDGLAAAGRRRAPGDDRWLLILDNLEQVLDAARDLDELLARCPGVAILATSLTCCGCGRSGRTRCRRCRARPTPTRCRSMSWRPPRRLRCSWTGPAPRVTPSHLTPANAAAVAEICRRLEGVPLAIELAAARTRLLSPEELLRRLTESLDALGTGTVDMPERQHTLRATVEWSVGLLDDDERSLLETMAVFVNGWTLEAAAEVAGLDEDRTLNLTEALAGHSLIYLDLTEHGPRSRMLETIRLFVAERLAARTDLAEIQRRHADHYRELAEQADRPLRGIVGQASGSRAWRTEAGNLAAAVHWYLDHDRSPLPHLLRVLWPFWFLADHMDETCTWTEQLLPTADSPEPQARAELVWTALVTALEVGDDAAVLTARERLEPLLAENPGPLSPRGVTARSGVDGAARRRRPRRCLTTGVALPRGTPRPRRATLDSSDPGLSRLPGDRPLAATTRRGAT